MINYQNVDIVTFYNNFSEKKALVHCISNDWELGLGVARTLDINFKIKTNKPFIETNVGDCILVNNVYNLITKDKYYNKPTYETLTQSLLNLKNNITDEVLIMPKIGCGLDKLNWVKVENILEEQFKNHRIIVCYL